MGHSERIEKFGMITRAMCVAALVGSVALAWMGWLLIQNLRAGTFGIYGIPFGVSIFVVSSVMIFSILIWWCSKLLNGIDVERRLAEEGLRKSYTQTEQLLSAITSILVGVTPEGKVIYWNAVAESTFRAAPEDVINRPLSDCGVDFEFARVLEGIRECQRKNHLVHVDDISFKRPEGQKGYLGFTVIPIRGAADSKLWFLLFGAEVTKRKQTNQLKDDFVSTVSHELRTPLAITKEGITLILDKIVGPINAKQENILSTARNNIDRLARIIESLLDVSRIEAGRVELRKKLLDLAGVVRAAALPFERRIREKNLELHLSFPEKEVQVYADPDKITQVVTNILDNAVKFTQKGFIEIALLENQTEIECAVRDSGVGLPAEDLPKMFTKFQQFGRVPGGGEKGTGLGLVIAKGIVELHNGHIAVDSILGKGAAFTFTLPKYVHERLLKESVRDGIRSALKNGSQTSLVIGSIHDFDSLRERISIDQLNDILENVRGIIKSSLRQTGDDSFQDMGEVAVVLTDCDKNSVQIVRHRLQKIADDYLVKKGLNGQIQLRFGAATYPNDARDDESLIQKAKEDGDPPHG